jgi:hypothetical protein
MHNNIGKQKDDITMSFANSTTFNNFSSHRMLDIDNSTDYKRTSDFNYTIYSKLYDPNKDDSMDYINILNKYKDTDIFKVGIGYKGNNRYESRDVEISDQWGRTLHDIANRIGMTLTKDIPGEMMSKEGGYLERRIH